MHRLRFYQNLKRPNLLGLAKRVFHYDEWVFERLSELEPIESESEEWYENKCYEILYDMGRQASLYSVSMTAIDQQGNRIIELEEQAREYRAQIRNLHKVLEEACDEVCEDVQEEAENLAMP